MQKDLRGVVIVACAVLLVAGLGLCVVGIGPLLAGAPIRGLITSWLFPLFVGVLLLIVLLRDPFRSSRSVDSATLAKGHHLRFTVGEDNSRQVDVRWDQVWGWLTATVDGRLVYRTLQILSFRTLKTIEFEVGEGRHRVRIEKRRPVMFSFAREQPLTAYVDGRPVGTADAVAP